jgi:hypothetical protein
MMRNRLGITNCFYLINLIRTNALNYLNDTINKVLASLPKCFFVLSALQERNGALYFSSDTGIIKIKKNKYEKNIPDLENKKKNKVKIDSNIWVTIPNKQNEEI